MPDTDLEEEPFFKIKLSVPVYDGIESEIYISYSMKIECLIFKTMLRSKDVDIFI